MSAALPMPKAKNASSMAVKTGLIWPARMPPGVNSSVPVRLHVQMMAVRKNAIEVPSRIEI